MGDFSSRDQLVREVGLPDYRTYLESELWGRIRRRVLRQANSRCCCCDNRATQVHHSRYTLENLAGNSLIGLHAICAECHELVHLNEEQFIALDESAERLETFIEADGRKLPESPTSARDFRRGQHSSSKAAGRTSPAARVTCPRCGKSRQPHSMLPTLGYCKVCRNRIAKAGRKSEGVSRVRTPRQRLIDTMRHVAVPQREDIAAVSSVSGKQPNANGYGSVSLPATPSPPEAPPSDS